MGLLVVLAGLVGVVGLIVIWAYLLREDRKPGRHGWLAVLPLLLLFGWVLELLITR
jgi:hypothetical protein